MRVCILGLSLLITSFAQARVDNPVAFIGQYIFNAVTGAPLSADSNGQLVSGIQNGEVSSTATATTTTSDVLLTGMTATPAAGTYFVSFSGDANSGTAGIVITLAIFIGGTAKAESQRKIIPFPGGLLGGPGRAMMSTSGIVTVNGSQAIEIRWSSSTAGATAAARSMQYVRLL